MAREISERIADLAGTPTAIVEELRDAGRETAAGQCAPAIRAVELRVQVIGMFSEKASTGAGKVTVHVYDSRAD